MVENNLRHFIEYVIVEIKLFFLVDYIKDYQTQQRRIVVRNWPKLLAHRFFFSGCSNLCVVYKTV